MQSVFSEDGRFISSKFSADTWRNCEATCVPKSADRQRAFHLYIVDYSYYYYSSLDKATGLTTKNLALRLMKNSALQVVEWFSIQKSPLSFSYIIDCIDYVTGIAHGGILREPSMLYKMASIRVHK